jgi:DNA-binding transcriptional regulator YhcF (GntR family)
MMRCPAWKELHPTARALYAELGKHYNGSNNGRIAYSVRQAAGDLRIHRETAWQQLGLLQERGFIEAMKRGKFSLNERHATEWRMTEFTCDVSGRPPTKDFMRWEMQNAVRESRTDGADKRTSTVRINEPEDENTPSYGTDN